MRSCLSEVGLRFCFGFFMPAPEGFYLLILGVPRRHLRPYNTFAAARNPICRIRWRRVGPFSSSPRSASLGGINLSGIKICSGLSARLGMFRCAAVGFSCMSLTRFTWGIFPNGAESLFSRQGCHRLFLLRAV